MIASFGRPSGLVSSCAATRSPRRGTGAVHLRPSGRWCPSSSCSSSCCRLIKLYSYGEVDEPHVQPELVELKRQRSVIEDRLREIRPHATPAAPALPTACLLE